MGVQQQVGAVGSQTPSDGTAQRAAGAGDERTLALQTHDVPTGEVSGVSSTTVARPCTNARWLSSLTTK